MWRLSAMGIVSLISLSRRSLHIFTYTHADRWYFGTSLLKSLLHKLYSSLADVYYFGTSADTIVLLLALHDCLLTSPLRNSFLQGSLDDWLLAGPLLNSFPLMTGTLRLTLKVPLLDSLDDRLHDCLLVGGPPHAQIPRHLQATFRRTDRRTVLSRT